MLITAPHPYPQEKKTKRKSKIQIAINKHDVLNNCSLYHFRAILDSSWNFLTHSTTHLLPNTPTHHKASYFVSSYINCLGWSLWVLCTNIAVIMLQNCRKVRFWLHFIFHFLFQLRSPRWLYETRPQRDCRIHQAYTATQFQWGCLLWVRPYHQGARPLGQLLQMRSWTFLDWTLILQVQSWDVYIMSLISWYRSTLVKLLQVIWWSRTMKSVGTQSSTEWQWLNFMILYQCRSPNAGRQGDMPHWLQMSPVLICWACVKLFSVRT